MNLAVASVLMDWEPTLTTVPTWLLHAMLVPVLVSGRPSQSQLVIYTEYPPANN